MQKPEIVDGSTVVILPFSLRLTFTHNNTQHFGSIQVEERGEKRNARESRI